MRILRTPHNVVSERQPQFVSDWGTYRISPNATLFSGAGEDALATLNRAGARGAAVLGAGAGFLFSSSRLTGAFTGAILGYFGGAYLARLLGTALEMQKSFTAQVAAK